METLYLFLRYTLNIVVVVALLLAWAYLIIPLWRQIRHQSHGIN